MGTYQPNPAPFDLKEIPSYLQRELRRVGQVLADSSECVFYRTTAERSGSLSVSAGISANWKVAGNLLLISTSATQTITGIQRNQFSGNRELVFFNVGTGVLVLKSEGTESSASNRFVLATSLWNLSAGAAATLWRDPYAFRWRGLSRT